MAKQLFDQRLIQAHNDAKAKWLKDRSERNTEAYHAAFQAMWPREAADALRRFYKGDIGGMEYIVRFFEEDPIFFRSGYLKEALLKKIQREDLNPRLQDRMRALCIRAVDTCDRREFGRYCKFAARIQNERLVKTVRDRLEDSDPRVRWRAKIMLEWMDRLRKQYS